MSIDKQYNDILDSLKIRRIEPEKKQQVAEADSKPKVEKKVKKKAKKKVVTK
jgi:hypothetical protein